MGLADAEGDGQLIAFMRIGNESVPATPSQLRSYLLVKLHELSSKTQKQKQIKEIVKNAFIASNMDIDEYINMIEEECHMCRSEINYVQKEKMKEYLLQTF